MSLKKAILHGKERRKRYRAGRPTADRRCTCVYCESGRAHPAKRREPAPGGDELP
jgi:hypothetical protein